MLTCLLSVNLVIVYALISAITATRIKNNSNIINFKVTKKASPKVRHMMIMKQVNNEIISPNSYIVYYH